MMRESGETVWDKAVKVGCNVGLSSSLYRHGEPVGDRERGKDEGEICRKPELVEGNTTL
jgi:hypothetical protein